MVKDNVPKDNHNTLGISTINLAGNEGYLHARNSHLVGVSIVLCARSIQALFAPSIDSDIYQPSA